MSTIEQPPQHQPYGYGPPPDWRPQQPQQPRQETNGPATGGFVTALVGAVLALVPFLGIVSWLICPVGLVLSIVGLVTASKRGGAGRGVAIAGTALAVVGLIICSVYTAASSSAMAGASRAAGSPTSSGSGASAPAYSAPSSSSAPEQDTTLPPGTVGEGSYEVGSGAARIAPGRYRTPGAPSDAIFTFCMASRQKSDGTTIGFPETTNEGPAFLTVRASDDMGEFTGGCTWTKVG